VPEVEFGQRQVANSIRERLSGFLADNDSRRSKTVELKDAVPDEMVQRVQEEAADSRRGMTSESVSLAQSFAAKRYKQVFSILTAPTKSWIDKRLGSDSADFWIQAEETDLGRIKGEGPVYRLRTNEHYERDFTQRTETIVWPDISNHREFERMDERKTDRYDNSGGKRQYYDESEVQGIREQTREQTKKQYRKQIAAALNDVDDITQSDIGEIFGVSRSRVSQIVNADD